MSAAYYVAKSDLPDLGGEMSWGRLAAPAGKRHPWGDAADWVVVHTIEEACGSDYSGGSYTRSNYDVIRDNPELAPHVISLHGAYGTYGICYVGELENQPEALRDAISSLADYPILDEDALSEHEMALEIEAWNDFGAAEFKRALMAWLDENDDAWEHDCERLTGAEVWAIWQDGCETFNVNGGSGYTIETGESVYFYVKQWFAYNDYTTNDLTELGLSSHRDSLTLDEIKAKTRATVVAGRDDELDTVCSVLVTQLGDLLVALCGYTPGDALTRGTIQFSTDSDRGDS